MSLIDGDEEGFHTRALMKAMNYLPEPYCRPEASWRRMMPTQPPVSSSFYIDLVGSNKCSRHKAYSHGHIYMDDIIAYLDASLKFFKSKGSYMPILRRAAPVLYGIVFESSRGESRRIAKAAARERREKLRSERSDMMSRGSKEAFNDRLGAQQVHERDSTVLPVLRPATRRYIDSSSDEVELSDESDKSDELEDSENSNEFEE